MALGNWPASRVALYCRVWLVGFPLVVGLAELFTPYGPGTMHGAPRQHVVHAPVSVDVQVRALDTIPLASHGAAHAVMLSVEEQQSPVDWAGWFLPPALFAGAWALARRRRTDGD